MITRRQFLAGVGLASGTLLAPRLWAADLEPPVTAAEPSSVTGSDFDPVLEVDLGLVVSNAKAVADYAGKPVKAVVKNNAYGLGMIRVAEALEDVEAVQGYAVAQLRDALALREAGLQKPVLLMGPVAPGDEAEQAVAAGITVMLHDEQQIDSIGEAANAVGHQAGVAVAYDVGLSRFGLASEDAVDVQRRIAEDGRLVIEETMAHLSANDETEKEELDRFRAIAKGLEEADIPTGDKHVLSSDHILRGIAAPHDVVRPGIALYGELPLSEQRYPDDIPDLKLAAGLYARVAAIHRVRSGEAAGYYNAYEPDRDTRVAVVSLGYTHGWPEQLAQCTLHRKDAVAAVLIEGEKVPVVATSSGHSWLDIGDRDIAIGDQVTLFDKDWPPSAYSESCYISPYDMLMTLAGRPIKRRYSGP